MNKVKIPFMPERPILAQAYIPFQQWPEKLYGLDKGLQEGTIFPELNQPYTWYEWEDYDE
jgi:hypothetical protein